MKSNSLSESSGRSSHNADIEPVRVLLADDHEIWRGGVRSMLEGTEFQVAAEASNGDEALAEVRRESSTGTPLDLILLDIRMDSVDGLEALQQLKSEFPQIPVIMLTTYDNPTYMARAVVTGAAGYLLKGIERDELLGAMRAVINGEMLLSRQDLARSLRGLHSESPGEKELVQPLSDREIEVLRLLATGLPNRDIAHLLFIAESTVKTHVEHIINKLGVSDRVQAAVWAARHDLTVH